MTANEQLIQHFYESFQKKDYQSMQNCYADTAVFNDEAFVNLNAAQVRAMWEMLLKRGKDLSLEFKNIHTVGDIVHAEWVATYTFSQTNRKITNRIKASFCIENGKIVKHTDQFNFYLWAKQALGTMGLLLGWTGFMKKKVQASALKSLTAFMEKK